MTEKINEPTKFSMRFLLSFIGFCSLGITFFRVACSLWGFFVLLTAQGSAKTIIPILVIIIVLSDFIDGQLFKKSKFSSDPVLRQRRRILDSVSDRICIQLICLPLAITDPTFLYPYFIITAKEIATSAVCIREYLRGFLLHPTPLAKINCALLGLLVISQLSGPEFLVNLQLNFVLIITPITCVQYYKISRSKERQSYIFKERRAHSSTAS